MSDWTDNPFAAQSSGGDTRKSPFADPSVTAAVSQMPEYNPFDESAAPAKVAPPRPAAPPSVAPTPKAAPAAAPASEEPAWTRPKGKNPDPVKAPPAAAAPPPKAAPQYTEQQPPVQTGPTPEEIKRQKEFEEREALARRHQEAKSQVNVIPGRPSNFPPFPPGCPTPFKPCFHLNIKGEIPPSCRTLARLLYYFWVLTFVGYFWNFIANLVALGDDKGTASGAGMSTVYFVIFSPCAYCCWFHPVYTALRTDSSLKFGWFFFVFAFQFLMDCFLVIGVPSTGAAGVILAIDVVKDHTTLGIIVWVAALYWMIHLAILIFLMKSVLSFYRSVGGSMSRINDEWKQERNKGIVAIATSDYAKEAAVAGAQSQWGSDSNA